MAGGGKGFCPARRHFPTPRLIFSQRRKSYSAGILPRVSGFAARSPNQRRFLTLPSPGVTSISIDGMMISVSPVAKASPKTMAEDSEIHHWVDGAP